MIVAADITSILTIIVTSHKHTNRNKNTINCKYVQDVCENAKYYELAIRKCNQDHRENHSKPYILAGSAW